MRRQQRFKIFREKPGAWVLYCARCDTREASSAWIGALQLIPMHVQFWHTWIRLDLYAPRVDAALLRARDPH